MATITAEDINKQMYPSSNNEYQRGWNEALAVLKNRLGLDPLPTPKPKPIIQPSGNRSLTEDLVYLHRTFKSFVRNRLRQKEETTKSG